MRFTTFALAVCPSLAARQQLGINSVSKTVSDIGEVLSKTSSPQDTMLALKKASRMVSGLMEQGPVGDNSALLSQVVNTISNNIYPSMDASQESDIAELNDAIRAVEQCNTDIATRQSPEGDLGTLHADVQEKQRELNRLQGVVDEKNAANTSTWQAFSRHMQSIPAPPDCPGLPQANMQELDAFFEESGYSTWFSNEQSSYSDLRDAHTSADDALRTAVSAYDVQKAVRDVQYCDWQSELVAACEAFGTCYNSKVDFYRNVLVPRVTADMDARIEVKKSGDTVIHQIQFLLGAAAVQLTPPVDTSRYQMEFPTVPAQGECDLTPLGSDEWVPPVSCQNGEAPGKPGRSRSVASRELPL